MHTVRSAYPSFGRFPRRNHRPHVFGTSNKLKYMLSLKFDTGSGSCGYASLGSTR